MELTIVNRTISNEVKNDYEANVGILPTCSLTEWVTQENNLDRDGATFNIQMESDKSVCFSGSFKTSDGGITWKTGAGGSVFHATVNNLVWAFSKNKIIKRYLQ